MADIKYEITQSLGVLSENAKGWKKELNLISWNEREPKYDIRDWSEDHSKMGKGVTLIYLCNWYMIVILQLNYAHPMLKHRLFLLYCSRSKIQAL